MLIETGKIQETMSALPERFKDLIMSPDIDIAISEITKRHGLDEQGKSTLKGETILLLIGAESGTDFIKNIQSKIALTEEKAKKIFVEINLVIVDPIMDNFYHRDVEDDEDLGLTREEEEKILSDVEKEREQKKGVKKPDEFVAPGGNIVDLTANRISFAKKIEPSLENKIPVRPIDTFGQTNFRNPITEEKMQGTFSLGRKETSYNEETTDSTSSPQVKKDPYREMPE